MPQFHTEFMVDMKCEGCVNAVNSKLETIEGIEKVDVDLPNQLVFLKTSVSAAVAEFKGPDIFGVVSWSINEYGDLTNGAASTGNLYNPFHDHTITEVPRAHFYKPSAISFSSLSRQPLGDLGTLEADQSGEAFYSGKKEKLKVADLIGRAVVV
ncbi:hypothetical protein Rs2_29556 [Raphanus sativus]|nr:hypothetical protein Rs2_29556 [Raphanus sativus]